MTAHFGYFDKWFGEAAFGNINLKREVLNKLFVSFALLFYYGKIYNDVIQLVEHIIKTTGGMKDADSGNHTAGDHYGRS